MALVIDTFQSQLTDFYLSVGLVIDDANTGPLCQCHAHFVLQAVRPELPKTFCSIRTQSHSLHLSATQTVVLICIAAIIFGSQMLT